MADSVSSTNSQLGKDAFLQLMVTQMKYQDPLQPTDNTQFLAQLAQFTSLEQMTNISQTDNSMLTTMNSSQAMVQMSFEHSLLGSNVSVTDADGNVVSGQVTAIKFDSGNPQLVINGQGYSLDSLTEME